MSSNLWQFLEALPGLSALPGVWEKHLGEQFPAFKALCLEESATLASSIPCSRDCGCFHTVIPREDRGTASAVCRCDPPCCPDIQLSIAEATPHTVNMARLCRALSRAYGLSARYAKLAPPTTYEVGAWSTDSVPGILTIQTSRYAVRSAVAQLSAMLRRPFILFAPTSDLMDAPTQALLEGCGAGFYSIEATVALTGKGTLEAARRPGELFAKFTPQPQEPVPEDTARQLFALAAALDSETGLRKALPSVILRLYCVDNLEPGQIARKLGCARALVYSRLSLLKRKLGRDPAELRQYSTHLQAIERSLSESRAARGGGVRGWIGGLVD